MNEVLGLAVGFTFIIIVIILAVLYFKTKDCPNQQPELVYNDKCEIISCSDITKYLYKGKCYATEEACEIDDAVVNGNYTITDDGSCILTSCEIEDAFVVGDKCIKKGDECPGEDLPANKDPHGEYHYEGGTTNCSLFSCNNGYDLKGGACKCEGNKRVNKDGECVCQNPKSQSEVGGCYDTGDSCDPTGSTVENGIYKIDDEYNCELVSCTEDTDKYTFTLNDARDKCDMKCKDPWTGDDCKTCSKFLSKDGKCLDVDDECGTYGFGNLLKKYVFANDESNGPLQCCKHKLNKTKKTVCDAQI